MIHWPVRERIYFLQRYIKQKENYAVKGVLDAA